MVLHEQPFELFEPEARLAHSMIVFDPRHALVPWAFFQHGALLGMGAPNGSRRQNIHYHAVGANTCASVHMLNNLFRGRRGRWKPARGMDAELRKMSGFARGGGHEFWTVPLSRGVVGQGAGRLG